MMTFMLALALNAPPYSPYIEDRVQALENQLKSMQAKPVAAAKPPVVLAYPQPMAGPGITVYAKPVYLTAKPTTSFSRTRSVEGATRRGLFGIWR